MSQWITGVLVSEEEKIHAEKLGKQKQSQCALEWSVGKANQYTLHDHECEFLNVSIPN